MKSGPLESRFSPWTIARADQLFWIVLGAILIAHLALAVWLPATEDELYYWVWSHNWSLSYFDHPPMVAWWIRLTTSVFGDTLFAIRLPAILVHLYIMWRIASLSNQKTIPLLLLFTPLSLFGALFMTPDIPLILFWFLYLEWSMGVESRFSNWSDDPVTRVYRKKPISPLSWIRGGLWLGLGLLSKYTMALAPLCLAAILVLNFRVRAWARGFLFHLLIAGIVFLPVIIFNYQHEFVPLLFQWQHTQKSVPFDFLWTFLGGQILLVGALPFLLLPAILLTSPSLIRIPRFRPLLYFFLVPFVFFLFKSTHHFLEANWSLVAYLAFWPLASFFISYTSFKIALKLLIAISFSVPFLASLLLISHLFHPLSFISPSQDRLEKLRAQEKLVSELASFFPDKTDITLLAPSYQWTSYFRFFGFNKANQLPGIGRPSHFTLQKTDFCSQDKAYFFQKKSLPLPAVLNCFSKPSVVGQFGLTMRGTAFSDWELWELAK